MARGRARKRRRVLIGFGAHAGWTASMIRGISRYLAEAGDLQAAYTQLPWSLEEQLEAAGEIDGLIARWTREDGPLIERAQRLCPVVVAPQPVEGLCCVAEDHDGIGAMAAEHFHQLGFEHVAVWYDAFGSKPAIRRCQAFRRRAEELQMTVADPSKLVQHFRTLTVALQREMAAWLASLPRPVGLFGWHDNLAHDLLNACAEVGLAVPEDAAVLGVDNDELLCELATPSLSSIDHGMERIGYEAARLLARLMDGHPPPDRPIVVSPEGVVERGSTDTLAVRSPDLRRAMRFIRDHACDGINVADVLDAVPMSRRKLEADFRRTLRRTVYQQILRVRLARARQLLQATDLPTPDVAARSGFSSAARLSEAFKRETGQTPTEFRRGRLAAG